MKPSFFFSASFIQFIICFFVLKRVIYKSDEVTEDMKDKIFSLEFNQVIKHFYDTKIWLEKLFVMQLAFYSTCLKRGLLRPRVTKLLML